MMMGVSESTTFFSTKIFLLEEANTFIGYNITVTHEAVSSPVEKIRYIPMYPNS